MNKRALRADILLLLTAGIWGFGFVAQRSGMEYVGPFAFNGIRFILGSLSLLPILFIQGWGRGKNGGPVTPAPTPGRFFRYSLAAGGCLFIAVTLQQAGIMFTTAGNAGFITGLYVALTPIFGIFLGRKTGKATWIGAVFTLTGLYFLSAAGHLDRINPGDLITAVSAIFWAFHVLLIDALVRKIDPLALSAGQFGVCGIFALAAAFFLEPSIHTLADLLDPGLVETGLFGWRAFPALLADIAGGNTGGIRSPDNLIPLLYGGFASVGIAYTLQVVAQRDAPPAHATIILCLEGCFAALGGVLLLAEPVGRWTLLGFVLMLCGMLITQWEVIAGGFTKKSA
ncbi:MAG: DMT family transporter [Treponema sp.]|jgi:drug/metabolite transporter (DMT)-like permease|nr:DMT family transporter [Treponema sp.]